MMLCADLYDDSRATRAPIVHALSAGALLRGARKKACFDLETHEGGGPKDWLHCPVAHMDLSDCSRKISKILGFRCPDLPGGRKGFLGHLRAECGGDLGHSQTITGHL